MTNTDTPPADDVREALAESLEDFMQDWYDRWAGPGETWVVRDMAASIVEKWLPAVRPSGTVTDAEVETVPTRCGKGVPGTVPSWAGEDQIDPCNCVRPAGHEGPHACAHEGPSDALEAAREVHP